MSKDLFDAPCDVSSNIGLRLAEIDHAASAIRARLSSDLLGAANASISSSNPDLLASAEKFQALTEVSSVSGGTVGDLLRRQMEEYENAAKHLHTSIKPLIDSHAEYQQLAGIKADYVKSMFETADCFDRVADPFPFPKIPLSPLFKTNEILEELKIEVAELHGVTEATADVQTKQAELVHTILKLFAEGAAASEKSGRQNILIARVGLVIAIIAIFLSVLQLLKS